MCQMPHRRPALDSSYRFLCPAHQNVPVALMDQRQRWTRWVSQDGSKLEQEFQASILEQIHRHKKVLYFIPSSLRNHSQLKFLNQSKLLPLNTNIGSKVIFSLLVRNVVRLQTIICIQKALMQTNPKCLLRESCFFKTLFWASSWSLSLKILSFTPIVK